MSQRIRIALIGCGGIARGHIGADTAQLRRRLGPARSMPER